MQSEWCAPGRWSGEHVQDRRPNLSAQSWHSWLTLYALNTGEIPDFWRIEKVKKNSFSTGTTKERHQLWRLDTVVLVVIILSSVLFPYNSVSAQYTYKWDADFTYEGSDSVNMVQPCTGDVLRRTGMGCAP